MGNLFAQTDAAENICLRIYFRFDSAVVSESYLDNPSTFATLDSLVRAGYPGEGGTIEIVAYSSPEGSYRYNQFLSERRAKAIEAYLEKKYPVLDGVFTVNAGVEAWDDLKATVESDDRISDEVRSGMLDVIASDADPDAKEKSLRSIPEFKSLYGDWYRRFRYAEVSFRRFIPADADSASFSDSFIAGGFADSLNTVALDTVSTLDVLYATSKSEISRDYKDNARVLDELSGILSSDNEIREVRITGAASPEASVATNERHSKSRAEALRKWILERRPDLAGRITVLNGGEAWDDFRSAVVADSNIDEDFRDKVLAIIDSKDSQDKKEARLKALKEYKDIYATYFPSLRYGRVEIASRRNVTSRPQVDTIPVKPEIDTIPVKPETDTIPQTDVHPQTDIIPEVTDTTDVTGEIEYIRKPVVAVSTNALYDLIATPNFAVEFPIGKKVSAYAEYTFPWWLAPGNDWAYEMLKWDIGGRYWLNADNTRLEDSFRGHFVGIDLSAGYYDFEPRHKGYQGEFQLASLEYGYAFKLSPRWRLDAVIGAGWIGTHYRYYEADKTDRHLIYQHHGETSYFGPTKLGVTFKYIFTTKKEVKR